MGQLLTIEGREVTYLAAGGELPRDCRENVVGFDLLEDPDLSQHPRLRRVLTTMVGSTPRFYGVLHWSDGTDLLQLDDKVRLGIAVDNDFAGALLAEPRTITCRNCEAQLRVLAVDTGQALFASTLSDRLRSHELKSSCPVCRTALGLPVVEFLGEDSVP